VGGRGYTHNTDKQRAKTPSHASGDAQKFKLERETAPTLDDCRRNALLFCFCGICGIFSPKCRERIGREPKDGSNRRVGSLFV
jgi:hypothetical protein